MIKKILGFVLAAAVITSCGSQFNKSRYGGYMWNRSGGKNQVEKAEANTSAPSQQNVEEKENNSDYAVALNVVDNHDSNKLSNTSNNASNSDSKKSDIISTKNKSTKGNFSAYSNKIKSDNPGSKILHKKINRKVNHHKPYKGGDVDAMWIVTLILCFLIPPLGVYLKDGSLTGLFWLVLILCIVGGGILFGLAGYYGGLYGVGVVLALLRFFDII